MESTAILIAPKNRKERVQLEELIQRMGWRSRSFRASELEDFGLALLMSEVDRTKKAPTARVLRQLQR